MDEHEDEPTETDSLDDIEEQYRAHLRDEKLADMFCTPPPLEDDVELIDADGEGGA